jgi:CheY-like chemotaxis protein
MSEGDGTPQKVLLVEDFEDARYVSRLALEERGYRVLEAANGEEALEVAARERPAIILMDLSLPILDGLQATERIRADATLRDTLIVAVTAHSDAQHRARALAAGCNAFLTKPIDFDWLDDLLNQLLPAD